MTVVVLPSDEAARGGGAELLSGLAREMPSAVATVVTVFAPVLSASSSSRLATLSGYPCHSSRNLRFRSGFW